MDIDYVYSSPSKRDIKTAILLCDREIIVDERLKEINFGIFERLPEKLRFALHIESEQWTDNLDMDYELYKGENLEKVIDRHKNFLNDIIHKHNNNETILIVGHGCSIYGLFKSLLNDQIKIDYPEFKFLNNAALIVELKNPDLKIVNIIN